MKNETWVLNNLRRKFSKKLKDLTFISSLVIFGTVSTLSSYADSDKIKESRYSIDKIQTNAGLEYRFMFDNRHFMTLIDDNRTLNLRPHPGDDINGWGSSLYAQPFLPGATLKHTDIESVIAEEDGIEVNASGKVSKGSSDSYGNWIFNLDFNYNETDKTIRGNGNYNITLDGQLSKTGDLNLYKIASNYLDNVPLLKDGIGDTGDMKKAEVIGDTFKFIWNPPLQPGHFPMDFTDNLSINVVGTYNNVDTAAQGYNPIAPAHKPSLKVELRSTIPEIKMMFGAMYDTSKSKLFWEDNIGITPLIFTCSALTGYNFNVLFESNAPLPLLIITLPVFEPISLIISSSLPR